MNIKYMWIIWWSQTQYLLHAIHFCGNIMKGYIVDGMDT